MSQSDVFRLLHLSTQESKEQALFTFQKLKFDILFYKTRDTMNWLEIPFCELTNQLIQNMNRGYKVLNRQKTQDMSR